MDEECWCHECVCPDHADDATAEEVEVTVVVTLPSIEQMRREHHCPDYSGRDRVE